MDACNAVLLQNAPQQLFALFIFKTNSQIPRTTNCDTSLLTMFVYQKSATFNTSSISNNTLIWPIIFHSYVSQNQLYTLNTRPTFIFKFATESLFLVSHELVCGHRPMGKSQRRNGAQAPQWCFFKQHPKTMMHGCINNDKGYFPPPNNVRQRPEKLDTGGRMRVAKFMAPPHLEWRCYLRTKSQHLFFQDNLTRYKFNTAYTSNICALQETHSFAQCFATTTKHNHQRKTSKSVHYTSHEPMHNLARN